MNFVRRVSRSVCRGSFLHDVQSAMRLFLGKIQHRTLKRLDLNAIPDLDTFFSWHKRPKSAKRVLSPASRLSHADTAIVLQGPLGDGIDFVSETLRHYQRVFNGAKIIISTWDSLKSAEVTALEELGVLVVTSTPPAYKGFSNVNLQIKSSLAGLHVAEKLGCRWLLKTRVDQRFYSAQSLSLFKQLVISFPLGALRGKQSGRIVVLTSSERLYLLSDFMTFGLAEDVISYWGADLVRERELSKQTLPQLPLWEKFTTPEVYLCSSFLERTLWKCKWTLEDWTMALSSRFIVVDPASVDFLWNKYSSREYLDRTYSNSQNGPVTMGDWFELLGKANDT